MTLAKKIPLATEPPWYLAQLKPGGLTRATTNLARQKFNSFMPMRDETRRRSGRWETRPRPLFPGYLFVEIPAQATNWRAINATYGVSKLVSLEGGHPTQVAPGIIAALRDSMSQDGQLHPHANFKRGDHVRVRPFSAKLAEIEAVPEEGRIYVLLDLMGRATAQNCQPATSSWFDVACADFKLSAL